MNHFITLTTKKMIVNLYFVDPNERMEQLASYKKWTIKPQTAGRLTITWSVPAKSRLRAFSSAENHLFNRIKTLMAPRTTVVVSTYAINIRYTSVQFLVFNMNNEPHSRLAIIRFAT